MKRIAFLLAILLPVEGVAGDIEKDRAWLAFKDVCLETVGDVKVALEEIPQRVFNHTNGKKIVDSAYRREQMINPGYDAWSYHRGNEWFMILSDYGSCAVRAPHFWKDYDKQLTSKHGYVHFATEEETHLTFEFYHVPNVEAPVIVIPHTEKPPGNRLAVIAYNPVVYKRASEKADADFPELPTQ